MTFDRSQQKVLKTDSIKIALFDEKVLETDRALTCAFS